MAVDRPIPHWRQGSRRWAARAGKRQTWPQRGSLYQAGTQSLTKTPWDSGWLTSARRVAARDQLPRRDIGHTGDGHTRCHPGHRAPGTREVTRQTPHLGTQSSPSTWLPELLGPGKGKKHRPNGVCPFVDYPRN